MYLVCGPLLKHARGFFRNDISIQRLIKKKNIFTILNASSIDIIVCFTLAIFLLLDSLVPGVTIVINLSDCQMSGMLTNPNTEQGVCC